MRDPDLAVHQDALGLGDAVEGGDSLTTGGRSAGHDQLIPTLFLRAFSDGNLGSVQLLIPTHNPSRARVIAT